MSQLKIVSKESHKVLQDNVDGNVTLSEASVVIVKANAEDIQQIKRDGNNAVITLKSGEQIVIVNFFPNGKDDTENSLVFEDEQHQLKWAQFIDANGVSLENITLTTIESIEPLLFGANSMNPWAWLAIPAVAAGIAIASHDNKDSTPDKDTTAPNAPSVNPPNAKDPITGTAEPGSTVKVTYPDGSTDTTIVGPDGKWTLPNPGLKDGDEIKVTSTDTAGNTSPETNATVDAIAPNPPKVNPPNGDSPITGEAEAGSTVTVTYPDGTTKEVVADSDGKWTAPNPGLKDGDELKVTAKDAAGNTSPETNATVDAIAPNPPKVNPPNGDSPITGEAEAGSTVTVTYPDGTTKEVVADSDGKWTAPNPGLKDGDELKVTAKDAAGNTSPETNATVDAIAPNPPKVNPPNGDSPITGEAEAGSTVTVTYPDGTTQEVIAGPDGKWTAPNPGLTDGDEIKVTAKDAAGNTSPETSATVDAIAPNPPKVNPPNGDSPITGEAEAGSTVTVTYPDGTTQEVIAGPDGKWTAPNPGLTDGDEIKVTATDAAGNTSPETNATVDATAPTAPVVNPPNGSSPITGSAEAGSTVKVTLPDGTVVSTTADASGNWTVPNPGLTDGDQIKVTATDAAGNTSPETSATVDATAPTAPVVNPPNGSSPITGSAEAGSTVKVTLPDGTVVSTTADANGNWTIPNPGLTDGDQIKVTATDAAGNTSPETSATVDATAPTAPVVNPPNGSSPITGSAEAGSTVKVTLPDGTVVSTTADANGNWTVPNPGLTDGDQIKVTATDAAGNTSPETNATVDATAPTAPVVNPPNGSSPITGSAEAGSTVKVTLPDGTVVSTTADASGNWTVPNPGLTDGDQIKVTATDAAGNTSPETSATVDATAPTAPVVNPPNGSSPITGSAEAGSTVKVTLPDGTVVSTTADANGNWTIPNPGLTDGDQIKVTATDAAGNTSPETSATVDATAPTAPVVNPPNGSSPITGSAEAGSTVKVTLPDGTVVSTTADANGNWTVPNPGLTDGDQIKVTATDAAGNTSPETNATVDATAPTAPVVNPPNGSSPITGSAEAGSTVKVTLPDGTVVSTTADANGNWTVPNPGLTDGDQIKVTATDAAGNTSPETNATVDATAPTAPVVNPPNGSSPITGSAEAGSTVKVTLPDGTVVSTTADANGNWTVPNPGLTDGDQIKVTATDAAGNTSPETNATVDTAVPTLAITASDVVLSAGEAVTVTFTFSEAVKGFDVSDILAAGGVISNLTTTDNIVWTATFTQQGTAQPSISVADNSYTDLAGNNGKGAILDASNGGFTSDNTPPTLAITASDVVLSAGEAVTVTFTFSEAVKGFDVSDILAAGGVISNLTTTDNIVWTATFTQQGTAQPSISVADNSYTDLAGNNGKGAILDASNGGFTSDNTPPTLAITASDVVLSAGEAVTVTFTFSEAVKGFDVSDILAAGGVISNLTTTDNIVWTATFTQQGTAQPSISVADNSYTDLAGNNGKGAILDASNGGFTSDNTPPTLAITASDVVLSAGEAVTVTFTFSEAVKGFDVSDIVAAGGVISNLTTTDNIVWTATFTQQGTAQPSISVADNSYTDLAGNNGKGATLDASNGGFTSDTTPPTLAITASDVVLSAGEAVTVTFTFSEAVKGFDVSDILAAGGIISNLTTTDNIVWTATFTQQGTAQPSISVADNSYTDLAGNNGKGAILDASNGGFTSDNTPPTLAITASDVVLSAGEAVTVTFTFSEAVKGFDVSDILAAGGVISNLTTTDNIVWTATFTQQGTAQPSISVADNSYTDLAGNNGKGAILDASNGGFTSDNTPPTLAITASDVVLSAGEAVTVTFTFSEAVKGFDVSDILAAGGVISNLTTTDNIVWTATFTQQGTAQPSISVADNSYTDLAGNNGKGAILDASNGGFTSDNTPPTLAITASDVVLSAGEAVTVTFTFSEAVKGFDVSDIVAAGGVISNLTTTDNIVWTATFTQQGTAQPSISVADNSYTDLAGNNGKGATLDASNGGFTSDTTPPTLAITASDVVLSAGEAVTVTFTFSEAVKGFDVSDIVAAGGVISNLTTTDNIVWTATFTQQGTAQPSISVADNSYTDLAGNNGKGAILDASNGGFTSDNTPPTLAITASDVVLSAGEAVTVTFTFSEAVKGFDVSDILAAGGVISNLTTTDNIVWTATFTQQGTAQPSISVADNSYTDLAGNNGKGAILDASNGGFTSDNTPPTLAITASDVVLSAGEAVTVTFTFSEAVKGFDVSDIVAAGGVISNLTTTDNIVWTATFTQQGTAQPSISVADNSYTDLAGNNGKGAILDASNGGFTSDTTPPTLAITASDVVLSAGEAVTVTFTFNEAVKGFDVSDILAAGGVISNLTTTDNIVWTATFTQQGTAQPSISVADNSYTDLAGNNGKGAILDASNGGFTSDNTPPTLAITASDVVLSAGEAVTVTFTFNEAVKGFDVSDILAAGGVISNLTTTDNIVWTATFTQQGTAQPSISVADNSYTDLAGNNGKGAILDASNGGFTSDNTPPTLAITASDVVLSAGEAVTVTFTFSEAVKGFDVSDIVAAGGVISNLTTTDNIVWTATFTQQGTAQPSISVADNSYTDLAGNNGKGAILDASNGGFTSDNTPPTLAITASDVVLSAGEAVTVTFTFSEAVKGFDVSDIVAAGGVISNLTTTDNIVWTATFTQQGTAQPSIKVADNSYTDLAGNNGKGATLDASNGGFTSDTTSPTLAISTDDAQLSLGEATTIHFTFSEAVKGFDVSDIVAAGGVISNLTTTDNIIWTATFTQDGTATQPSIKVADNSYTDLAGNNGKGATLDASNGGFTSDTTPPTLIITADDVQLSIGEATTIRFTFSEGVTGFDGSDVVIAGGTLTNFTKITNTLWTATFTQQGTAQPSINVADNSYTDLAGNNGKGATLDASNGNFTADLVPLNLTITDDVPASVTNGPVTFTFSFDKDVTAFTLAQIQLTGGTAGTLTKIDNRTYTLIVTPTANSEGNITVSVAQGSVKDAAGNGNNAATGSQGYDTAPPTTASTIQTYTDDVGASQGAFGTGTTTDDRAPILNGTVNAALAAGEQIAIYKSSDNSLIGYAIPDATGLGWTYALNNLTDSTTYSYYSAVVDAAGNIGAHSPNFSFTVSLNITVNTESTTDTTPLITGSLGFSMLAGEYLEVKVNNVTYSSQNGAVVIDSLNNTWYVQVPNANALVVGSYDVAAVLKNATGNVASDHTLNELVVTASPTITFTSVGASSTSTGTALTIAEDGSWRILSNATVFTQSSTNPQNLGNFTSVALVGIDQQQQSSFIDFDRDGRMDILGADTAYTNGQQSFQYNADGTYSTFQVGSYGITGKADNGNGNTNVWFGGAVGIDMDGDGFVDIIYGDQTPDDGSAKGGFNTTFVLNTNGTIAGFQKTGAFTVNNTSQNGVAPTNTGNSSPDREISGVDFNNDGYVDIVFHGSEGTSKTNQGGSTGINTRLVMVKNGVDGTGNMTLTSTQLVTGVFKGDNSTTNQYTSLTWADFNGDGFMDLVVAGQTGATNGANTLVFYNDGAGGFTTGLQGVGVATNVQNLADTVNSNTSLAVDWNGDGKVDMIEIAGASQGTSVAANNIGLLWLNGGTGANQQVNWTSQTILAQANLSGTGFVTGAQTLDLDWDGDQDLVVFRAQGQASSYIENKSVIQDGTSIVLRILDKNGLNAFYGNTVALVDEATGQVVATQMLNPQSGVNTQNSSGLVYFYGLDATKSYSAVLLSHGNDFGGVSSIMLGSTPNVIENVNSTWGGLKAIEKNHSYVLTAENGTTASNSVTAATDATNQVGIVGTGYNDTLYATAGTHTYNGAGGSEFKSGVWNWTNNGGLDIVDYKLAGSTALTIDLSNTGLQSTGFGQAKFINVEGAAGANGNDIFTDNASNNLFEGRGGNDTFNLLNGGNDTLLYKLLSAADATGGNGTDQANGFHVGTWEATPNADRIDVHDLLQGFTGTSENQASFINGVATMSSGATIQQYLNAVYDGVNTQIQINTGGLSGNYTTLLTLNNVHVDLVTLLANHQLVLA